MNILFKGTLAQAPDAGVISKHYEMMKKRKHDKDRVFIIEQIGKYVIIY